MDMYKRASIGVPQALALPPKWLGMYEDFIVKNASAVAQIESALRSLTYIIPGMAFSSTAFNDNMLTSPQVASANPKSPQSPVLPPAGAHPIHALIISAVHSGVQVLSLYHDSLLARAIARLPGAQKPHPSPHNRYTKFWTQKSPTYKRIALTLQMIQYTELLWEMAAKRKGEKVRWRVVVLLEAIKALCRLLLLRLTNSRPLLSPPLPEREVDPSTLEEKAVAEDHIASPPSERSDDAAWTMPRTGLSMPNLPESSDISSYLLSKVLTADDIKPPKALLHRVSGRGELAECLYILRPVIYALAMQHWSADRKSWRPWLLGVSIEYGARQLAKQDFQQRLAGGLRGLTGLEREELRKRGWALGWWVMRGAFYENITK